MSDPLPRISIHVELPRDVLGEHGVPVIDYPATELAEELRGLDGI